MARKVGQIVGRCPHAAGACIQPPRSQNEETKVPEPEEPLSPVVDRLNRRFGRNTIAFGQVPAEVRKFSGHAALSTGAGELGVLG
jgi:hypothetical protein